MTNMPAVVQSWLSMAIECQRSLSADVRKSTRAFRWLGWAVAFILCVPTLADAAYPKPKQPVWKYRVECSGAADSGACAWQQTIQGAINVHLAQLKPLVSIYNYPCERTDGVQCQQECTANWISLGFTPFQSNSYVTTALFKLGGSVANDDTNQCVPATQQTQKSLYRNDVVDCLPGFTGDPANSSQCICPAQTGYYGVTDSCKVVRDRTNWDNGSSCKSGPDFGKPIFPTTGSERLDVSLLSLGKLELRLRYDSRRGVATNKYGVSALRRGEQAFDAMWESNFHRSLDFSEDSPPSVVRAWRGSGRLVTFTGGAMGYSANPDINDRLERTSGGWRYTDTEAMAQETFDNTGRLQTVRHANGSGYSLVYSDATTPITTAPVAGLLIEVRDDAGRKMLFEYEQPAGTSTRVKKVISATGQQIGFSYTTAGYLSRITWPNGLYREFRYENSALPWALTGQLDESLVRTHSIAYDAGGRAYDTQAAGGVDRYTATWTAPPTWEVLDTYDPTLDVLWRDYRWSAPQSANIQLPNGQFLGIGMAQVLGMPRVVSMSQPAGAGCAASSSATTYDANGNTASRTDFNGNLACLSSDATRNLESSRVEGLAAGSSCAVTAPSSALPAGSRKITTQWHPDWALRTKVAEPGRLTTFVYNGQPDPLAGGTALCAPAGAVMPDGKPIAVLCRQVEQATTDADGSAGFSAQLQSGVANRTRSWTYDVFGRVLSETDPRGKSTVYAYYGTTSFMGADPNAAGYSVGDLQAVTDPAGLTTRYLQYDKAGNWIQSSDPNDVVTARTFDERGRLRSLVTAGLTITYDYWPTGLPRKTTQADGSWVQYTYDDAHRLWKVEDNLGNRITYVLDKFGNRTVEEVKDAVGVLRRQLARSIDALGRVQQVTGRE